MKHRVGARKKIKDKNVCGFPRVIIEEIATNGTQVGTAVELPKPTKCQESTYRLINSIAESGATGNAPPAREPNLFLA